MRARGHGAHAFPPEKLFNPAVKRAISPRRALCGNIISPTARLRASSDIVIQSIPAVGHSFAPRPTGAAMVAAVAAMKERGSGAVIGKLRSGQAKDVATTWATEYPQR